MAKPVYDAAVAWGFSCWLPAIRNAATGDVKVIDDGKTRGYAAAMTEAERLIEALEEGEANA